MNIHATGDDSIAVRYSCRSAVCGSCGMLVNGAPVLACRTQLTSLIGDQVLIEPLPNMEIVKDMVVDMKPFWEAYRRVEPWLHVNGDRPEKERLQSPAAVTSLDPYVNCILCACCYGSCPVVSFEEKYLGPAAIAKLFRFMQDSRDKRGPQFLEKVNNATGPVGMPYHFPLRRCLPERHQANGYHRGPAPEACGVQIQKNVSPAVTRLAYET